MKECNTKLRFDHLKLDNTVNDVKIKNCEKT